MVRIIILCMAFMAHAQTDREFEIYPIKGHVASITGSKLNNLQSWRKRASKLAEKYRDTVFVNMNPAENAVYLTIDDGPDAVNTLKMMDILVEYGVSATFFFPGWTMKEHKEVVKQVYDAGFPIGLHGYSHKSMRELTEKEIIAELNSSNDLLEKITGFRTTIMRPPFGAVGDKQIKIISGQNFKIYLWSIDVLDWAVTTPAEILQNIKKNLRPGDIILMHSGTTQPKSAKILPSVIEFIKESGYEIRALPY